MPSSEPPRPLLPAEGDIDESGVDRAQIRAMLQLSPEERLLKIEEFVESVLEIRELNEPRPVRAALPVLRATLDELRRRS